MNNVILLITIGNPWVRAPDAMCIRLFCYLEIYYFFGRTQLREVTPLHQTHCECHWAVWTPELASQSGSQPCSHSCVALGSPGLLSWLQSGNLDLYFIAAPSLPPEDPVTAFCPGSTHKRPHCRGRADSAQTGAPVASFWPSGSCPHPSPQPLHHSMKPSSGPHQSQAVSPQPLYQFANPWLCIMYPGDKEDFLTTAVPIWVVF